jgi:exopolyphosphatase/guanosine-5'-triphosphate,3'-diphosphate pyrophosphatase
MPEASRHRQFASLDSDRRGLVEWLAGMLRVADGLDCTHARGVGRLACEVGDKAITVHLEAVGDCRMEVEGGRQKQDLLERKTRRRIIYRC